jgi:signal transduction histidine kinase
MPGGIRAKWRPPLALVLGFTVASVLCLPLGGILALRLLLPLIGYEPALIAVAVGVLLLAVTLALVLWRILLRPIAGLAARAEAVAAGDPGALEPLPHYGTREMERLGRQVLDMGRTLKGREAMLRSYADHATHELKSPLTVVRGAAELLEIEDLPPEDRSKLLERIDTATERMTALLNAQRALARAQDPALAGQSRLSAVVDSLRADHPTLTLTVTQDGDLPFAADGLAMILTHLMTNAAGVGATELRLTAAGRTLTVTDNGPGVSDGNRDRIFDPFFTTRRAGGGTGMGLPIVRRMLEAHGATITLGPNAPGAVFEIGF